MIQADVAENAIRKDTHDTNLLIYAEDAHTPKPGNGDVTVNTTTKSYY